MDKKAMTNEDWLKANEEKLDYQDCRPERREFPEDYLEAVLPEHVKQAIAERAIE